MTENTPERIRQQALEAALEIVENVGRFGLQKIVDDLKKEIEKCQEAKK